MHETATLADLTTDERTIAPANRKVEVLRIGPWHLPEFRTATSAIEGFENWPLAENIDQIEELLTSSEHVPELLLWAQPLPGTVRQQDVDQLQRLAPLIRTVVVAGTWCEGEMRTGNPPAGVIRLYWYELAPWWNMAIARQARGQSPPWSAPLTATLAGRYLPGAMPANGPLADPVAVDTLDFEVFETIAAVLKSYGAEAVWSRRGDVAHLPDSLSAGIWDGSQLGVEELSLLKCFSAEVRERGGNVVALLDFPRVEHFLMAPGVQVLAKPYIVDELAAACGLAAHL